LAEVATAVKSVGAEPLICEIDLKTPEAPETLIRAALDRFGRIDALLNIAGAVPQIDLFEMTFERLRGIYLRQRRARSKTGLCRCSGNKRCHHRSC
jgi:3-oxoacyl-[acyl-carrier protein] reductase